MIQALIYVIPCLMGLFLFIQRFAKLTIAQSILLTVSLLGITNYLAILYAQIYWMDSVLMTFGFAWLFFEIFYYFAFKPPPRFSVAPLIIFVGMIILIIFAIHDAHMHYWDEFSFWGKISKWIFQTNMLPKADTPINFKDYPPGAAVFHYFIYRLVGYFSEPNAYLAQSILVIAPVLAIAAAAHADRQFTQVLGLFIVLIASIAFYEHALFHKLYVDIVVGCYFASAISLIYLTDNWRQKYLTLLPVIVFLPLIKQVGLFFAEFAMVMLLIDFLLQSTEQKPSKRLFFSYFILTAILVFLIHHSWIVHYQHLNVDKTFRTQTMHTASIIKDLIYSQDATINTIKYAFYKAWLFSGKEISSRLHTSVAALLGIFIFLSVLLLRFEKCILMRKRYAVLLTFLCGGLIAYSIGLLVFYMYSFSVTEAVRIACFGRYMHIYLVAFGLIMIGLLSKYVRFSLQNNKYFVSVVTIAFIAIILQGKPHERMLEKRNEVIRISQLMSSIKPNAKVFVIYQNDQQDDSTFIHMLKYELLPITVNACASFGPTYYPGDYSTCDRTPQELRAEMKDYDYVLIAHTDEQFWRKYGEIFAFSDKKIPQFFSVDRIKA